MKLRWQRGGGGLFSASALLEKKKKAPSVYRAAIRGCRVEMCRCENCANLALARGIVTGKMLALGFLLRCRVYTYIYSGYTLLFRRSFVKTALCRVRGREREVFFFIVERNAIFPSRGALFALLTHAAACEYCAMWARKQFFKFCIMCHFIYRLTRLYNIIYTFRKKLLSISIYVFLFVITRQAHLDI